MCHYSYFITDRCPRLSTSSFYLHPYQLFPFLSSLSFICLYRASAPRLGQHQRVSLLAGLWRGLGDGPPLQLALWESRHHQDCGKSLQRWNYIACDHDPILWPLHLHGQQQAGLQFCHLHCRYELFLLWLVWLVSTVCNSKVYYCNNHFFILTLKKND